jgi:uncharacterized protein with von Willebrand factor type A (vWA) domain
MGAQLRIVQETAAGVQIRSRLAGFVRNLRDNGFLVGLAETRDALRIIAGPDALRVSRLRPALRALFCARPSDWERFDEVFDAFWLGHGMKSVMRISGEPPKASSTVRKSGDGMPDFGKPGMPDRTERRDGPEHDNPADGRGRREGASRADSLGSVDFRHITDPAQMEQAHSLAERLSRSMRARLTRREKLRRTGPRLDLRRTIHRSIATGGVPLELVHRQRKDKPLKLVILLDASGSMSLYSAVFIRFMHGVLDTFREADAFLFHTRLVHVSDALREKDAARAIDRMALMSQGVGGGTKIGESLATFNQWHAKRVITSRTAVMIVSDGYDTGEPETLASEMQALRRRCRRIVWLNPMLGWNDYSPEARGIKAALPFIDLFAPAHNLESLVALEPYLARI